MTTTTMALPGPLVVVALGGNALMERDLEREMARDLAGRDRGD